MPDTAPARSGLPAMNRVDLTRPDAPVLARPGPHPVGVRTLHLTNPDQIDILADGHPRTDRDLTVELWYPAAPGTAQGTAYPTLLRDGVTPVTLHGRAARDATPESAGPNPLVVLSHGYPGNRFLMAHLAEHLASQGYVVGALDHPGSTYDDKAAFAVTLLNRPLDQAFALDQLARLPGHGIDGSHAAIVGYSMGGYGALISGGAGLTAWATEDPDFSPQGVLARHRAGRADHEALIDPRLCAVVAFGPWGCQRGVWDAAGLAGLRKPTLIVAGSQDEVSGYDTGMRRIFEEATGTARHLLTFHGAGHNAAAPIPAPAESWAPSAALDFPPFDHYADAVWDTVRMNNIAQHVVTAFLNRHLRGDTAADTFLHPGDAPDWPGFAPNTSRGLSLEHRAAGT